MDLKNSKTITLKEANGYPLPYPIEFTLDPDLEEANIIKFVDKNLFFIGKNFRKQSYLYIID